MRDISSAGITNGRSSAMRDTNLIRLARRAIKCAVFSLALLFSSAAHHEASANDCPDNSKSDRTYPPFIEEKRFVDLWNAREQSFLRRLLFLGQPPVEYFILRTRVLGQTSRSESAIWGTGMNVEFEILEALVGDPTIALQKKVISFPDKEIMNRCRVGLGSLSQLTIGSQWIFPSRAKAHGQFWQLLTFPHFLEVRDGIVSGVLYNWENRTEQSSLQEFRERLATVVP